MVEASLLQRLLGQPSQRYALPAPREYYSDKPTMMRIAAMQIPDAPNDDSEDSDVFYTPRSSIIDDPDMAVWVPPPPKASRVQTPSIMMNMAVLLEEEESRASPRSLSPPSRASSTRTPSSAASSSATHRRTRTEPAASYTPTPLPSGPPDLPSYGTPAYTSLVIPHAPAPPNLPSRSFSISKRIRTSLLSESVDLTRSRLAQATMASVEVVGGLAGFHHNQPPRLGFTHYRAPPADVPKAGVLVQVWAVGLDAFDLRLLGSQTAKREWTRTRTQSFGRFVGRTLSRRTASDASFVPESESSNVQVGFIPGRSFVGRVLECGWEVREEVARRGEWVVGLLDIRKSGALAEFITADRHRIHRVPYPQTATSSFSSRISTPTSSAASSDSSPPPSVSFRDSSPPSSRPSSRQQHQKRVKLAPPPERSFTVEELALLPLGLPAYRAVRTLVGVTASFGKDVYDPWGGNLPDPPPERPVSKKTLRSGRRALVLHGHAGAGGLVARMLVREGWRVCVHAPGSLAHDAAAAAEETEEDRRHMAGVQKRVRAWGVEEVVFDDGGGLGERGDGGVGATARAVERLIEDGDAFDAVVDTVGGRAVWEAGERLLVRSGGSGRKQFTTTVGDWPARPVPSAKDNFRVGLRALRGSQSQGDKKGKRSEVGYAWVSSAQDVDWEGQDVRDSLAALLSLARDGGVRPAVDGEGATLPFERATEFFTPRDRSVLCGGSVVVRVAG